MSKSISVIAKTQQAVTVRWVSRRPSWQQPGTAGTFIGASSLNPLLPSPEHESLCVSHKTTWYSAAIRCGCATATRRCLSIQLPPVSQAATLSMATPSTCLQTALCISKSFLSSLGAYLLRLCFAAVSMESRNVCAHAQTGKGGWSGAGRAREADGAASAVEADDQHDCGLGRDSRLWLQSCEAQLHPRSLNFRKLCDLGGPATVTTP